MGNLDDDVNKALQDKLNQSLVELPTTVEKFASDVGGIKSELAALKRRTDVHFLGVVVPALVSAGAAIWAANSTNEVTAEIEREKNLTATEVQGLISASQNKLQEGINQSQREVQDSINEHQKELELYKLMQAAFSKEATLAMTVHVLAAACASKDETLRSSAANSGATFAMTCHDVCEKRRRVEGDCGAVCDVATCLFTGKRTDGDPCTVPQLACTKTMNTSP